MTTTQSSRAERALGVRGLRIFSGMLREEYLPDLRNWNQASRVYREMSDDAVIGTLIDAIRTPLLAADFDVPAVSEAEGDKVAAEWLLATMNQMNRQTWRAHVSDALESVTYGFAYSEVILEKRDDGRLWLSNIDPRGQETLYKWEWEKDRVQGMIQRDPVSGAMYTIPIDKAVHVTFRGRKGNPQGNSLLRSLFRPWLKLKYMENFEAIGIERDVGGMAVIDFPDPEKWHGPQSLDELKTIFESAMQGLRMDENMWLLVPPGARASSWGGGRRSYNVREAIAAKQKEILMRFFAQFLFLGMEAVGTQSLVKGSQDFFSLALKSVQQELLEAWNLQLVPLLFAHNTFPGITELPKITWNDPGKVDVTGLIQSYAQAVSSQLITPQREDEEHARSLLDLPDLPEGEGEGPRGQQPASPFPFSRFQGPPGPPPRPGLVWNPDTHRWIREDGEKDGETPSSTGGGTDALSFQQEDAIISYSGEQYDFINSNLRAGTVHPQTQKLAIDPIDEAIAEHGDVSIADAELFRGVGDIRKVFGTDDATALVGTTFADDAFTSFSTSIDVARSFRAGAPPPVILRTITAAGGINGLAMEKISNVPEEKEVLLPRSLHYEVLGFAEREIDGQQYVILDVGVTSG